MNKILAVLLSLWVFSGAYSQSVDFTYQSTNGLFCAPSLIQFTQTSTGNPVSFIWDFGNNQNGYTANETSTYNTAGTYTVKLTAIFSDRTIQVSKTIVINPPVKASIAVDRDYICLPGNINFTGSGNGSITNYQWNFGDGSPFVNTSSAGTSHNFTSYGTYKVTLRATDVSGCYGDTNIVISVKQIAITTSIKQSLGCAPSTVVFTGNVNLPPNSTVSSYSWNFGDGGPAAVTTTNTISHTYLLAGSYSPQLSVTTSEGCTRTYFFGAAVIFGSPPVTTIAYPKKAIICGSENALLVAKGTNADRYFWAFGDGTNLSTTDTIVAHKYTTLGTKTISVTAYNNKYCAGVTTKTSVTVVGVIGKYTVSNTCTDKNIYSFANTSLGNVSSSLWDFGDGVQLPNNNTPVHPYSTSGQFLSSLIVNDVTTGCADTAKRMIYTAVPELTSKTNAVCKNDSVTFAITNNYTDTAARYTWNLLGAQTGPGSNDTLTVYAANFGNYNNFVVITRGPQFCSDTIRPAISFFVSGPNLNFAAPATICFNNPVVITNNSQPFLPADTVKLWYWNYGEAVQNDSVYQPAAFQYKTSGTYNIVLTAIDKNGCKDTLAKTIRVNPSPFLRIKPMIDTICAGQSITLVAVNNDNAVWSPAGTLSCVNCDTTIATPLSSAKYYVTVTNAFNCVVKDSNYIEVYTPFTATPVYGNASICIGKTVALDVMPKGKKVVWSPTTALSDAAIYNPTATPLQSTSYTATLTDSAGCFSSNASVDINVNPLPVVDAGPDRFYPRGTNFSLAPAYSNNVNTYSWTPAVLLSCGNCAMPSGIANYTQEYIVKVTSDSGCVASDSITINTECKSSDLYMPKAFTPNNDGLNDYYYPLAKGFRIISAFIIYNRRGKVVFTASNYPPNNKSFGWDGKFKGIEQSADTYVYTVEAICEIGEKVFIKGSFVLFR